jgi:hypothetical protein
MQTEEATTETAVEGIQHAPQMVASQSVTEQS